MKRAYYSFMYEVTDSIMWFMLDDRDHWFRWWTLSERYRKLRDLG